MHRKQFHFHTLFPPSFAALLHLSGQVLSLEYGSSLTALGLAVWMLYWWINGTVSLGITALIPIVYLPITGLSPLNEVSVRYANPIIFLFLGGFMLAIALEKHGVHTYFAQRIVKTIGLSARQRIRAMLFSSALLSMWISNTATALIMLPIAVSFSERSELILNINHRFHHRLFLAIAAGANIGGIATLVGTPPNMFFAAFLQEELGISIAFFQWLIFGLPISLILLFFANLLLQSGISKTLMIPETIESKRLNANQKKVLLVFGLVAFFWIVKPLLGSIISNLHDAVIAFAGILLLQIIPQTNKQSPMIEWRDIAKLPWDIILLFGGGLSLAAALQLGGVFEHLKLVSELLGSAPAIVAIVAFCVVGIFLTEGMSNIAMVAVLLPLVLEISTQSNLSFYALALPLVIGASCAFMLPIATPPNAIVFGAKRITVAQMMTFGIKMNIIATIVISAIIFGLSTSIPWL